MFMTGIKWTYPKPIIGYDDTKSWWEFLKSLHRKYKLARLNDDIQTQYNAAIAIRIVQKDGGCKLDQFPELGIIDYLK